MTGSDESGKIGVVTHYYNKAGVAVIALEKPLAVGEEIELRGRHGAARQTVSSMQQEHAAVDSAGAGESVAVKLDEAAREGDSVFRAGA